MQHEQRSMATMALDNEACSREDRHMMRQRGAGVRALKSATFGFTFAVSAPLSTEQSVVEPCATNVEPVGEIGKRPAKNGKEKRNHEKRPGRTGARRGRPVEKVEIANDRNNSEDGQCGIPIAIVDKNDTLPRESKVRNPGKKRKRDDAEHLKREELQKRGAQTVDFPHEPIRSRQPHERNPKPHVRTKSKTDSSALSKVLFEDVKDALLQANEDVLSVDIVKPRRRGRPLKLANAIATDQHVAEDAEPPPETVEQSSHQVEQPKARTLRRNNLLDKAPEESLLNSWKRQRHRTSEHDPPVDSTASAKSKSKKTKNAQASLKTPAVANDQESDEGTQNFIHTMKPKQERKAPTPAVQPCVPLASRSTNVPSPKQDQKRTKAKTSQEATRRQGKAPLLAGFWSKEAWFEPTVPSTLLTGAIDSRLKFRF